MIIQEFKFNLDDQKSVFSLTTSVDVFCFRSSFERTNVCAMIWVCSGPYLHNCFGKSMIRGNFGVAKCDRRQIQAHSERTRCFERPSVGSKDTLVWEDAIRGYFRQTRSLIRGQFRMAPRPGQFELSTKKTINTNFQKRLLND